VLTKAGATVETADNERIGLDKMFPAEAHTRAFDIVLMDMQMPVLDDFSWSWMAFRPLASYVIVATRDRSSP